MITLEYYVYGILVYIPLALVFSYTLSVYHEYKANSSKPASKQPAKPKNTQTAKIVKMIPDDQVGYCNCCETYLVDDSYYYSHVDGKKHKTNVAGLKNWMKFVSREEYSNNHKAKKVQKARVQAQSEDYDEGWILVKKMKKS